MTPEEARLNLDACTLRPSDADAEARSLAGKDDTLKGWVDSRTAFDEKVAEAFHAVPVPSGLQDRLLAAMMAEAAASVAPVKRARAVMMSWLALAAVLVISGVGLWWNWSSAQPKAWELEALAVVHEVNAGDMPLDEFSNDLGQLKAVLAAAKAPMPENLPKDFKGLKSLGCKVIEIGGRPASIVCFRMGAGKEAHLITFQAKDLRGAPPQGHPLFATRGDWHTATWSSGDQGYLLATEADLEVLKGLFAGVGRRGEDVGRVG